MILPLGGVMLRKIIYNLAIGTRLFVQAKPPIIEIEAFIYHI